MPRRDNRSRRSSASRPRVREGVEPVRPPYLSPAELYDQWPGDRFANPLGFPQDRRFGQNWPVLRNEQDLRQARAFSRLLADTNPLVIGFAGHVTNFVVGAGYRWTVGLKGRPGNADTRDPDAAACQRFLDEFRALNGWGEGGEAVIGRLGDEDDCEPPTNLEREGWQSAMEDGEFFLRLFLGGPDTHGVPTIRKVNPECVLCPPGETTEGPWSFGIQTDPDDRQRKIAYHITDPDADPAPWGEVVPAARVLHLKLNAKTDVKRGVPDFWPLEHEAQHLRKTWRNITEVSAILSAIAYIRQHAAGVSRTQIGNMLENLRSGPDERSGRYLDPWSPADVHRTYTRMDAGAQIDVTNGQEWVPPPMQSGVGGFVQGMQAVLRIFGLRWGCPEYFSGDASNANFASTLVAGGPFERATIASQQTYKHFQMRLAVRALTLGVRSGRLTAEQVGRVSVNVTAPAVAIANRSEDTRRRETLYRSGVLSRRTWAAEEGLDPDVEAAQRKQEDAADAQAKQAQQQGPGPGSGKGGPANLSERRVWEEFREEDHPRDDHGHFVKKEDLEAAKSDPEKAKELRAKITNPDELAKLDKIINDGGNGPSSAATPAQPSADATTGKPTAAGGKMSAAEMVTAAEKKRKDAHAAAAEAQQAEEAADQADEEAEKAKTAAAAPGASKVHVAAAAKAARTARATAKEARARATKAESEATKAETAADKAAKEELEVKDAAFRGLKNIPSGNTQEQIAFIGKLSLKDHEKAELGTALLTGPDAALQFDKGEPGGERVKFGMGYDVRDGSDGIIRLNDSKVRGTKDGVTVTDKGKERLSKMNETYLALADGRPVAATFTHYGKDGATLVTGFPKSPSGDIAYTEVETDPERWKAAVAARLTADPPDYDKPLPGLRLHSGLTDAVGGWEPADMEQARATYRAATEFLANQPGYQEFLSRQMDSRVLDTMREAAETHPDGIEGAYKYIEAAVKVTPELKKKVGDMKPIRDYVVETATPEEAVKVASRPGNIAAVAANPEVRQTVGDELLKDPDHVAKVVDGLTPELKAQMMAKWAAEMGIALPGTTPPTAS